MTSDTLEQRIRNLEIRALAAERVSFMLAFYVALEMKSGTPLKNLASTLKIGGHNALTDPDEQKLFLEYTSDAAEVVSSLGDTIKGGGKALTKEQMAEVETRILEILYDEVTESS